MEIENELDDKWMKEFENLDKDYEKLYNNDIFFINVHFLYINNENVIDNIVEQKFIMSNVNYIHRDELIGLIKRNFIRNNNRYVLLSILKYNFNLEPQNIDKFLKAQDVTIFNSEFFTPIKNIDTIKFEKTIDIFQDLNDIFFVFYEKPKNNNSEVIKSDFYTNITKNHSVTKRVFFNLIKKHKKTQRK
jgi:hypothetical protein